MNYLSGEPHGHKITLLRPFEHKEPEDDDTGLPESPIYSNYVKYLWKAHRRSGGVQVPADFRENAAGKSRDSTSPAKFRSVDARPDKQNPGY